MDFSRKLMSSQSFVMLRSLSSSSPPVESSMSSAAAQGPLFDSSFPISTHIHKRMSSYWICLISWFYLVDFCWFSILCVLASAKKSSSALYHLPRTRVSFSFFYFRNENFLTLMRLGFLWAPKLRSLLILMMMVGLILVQSVLIFRICGQVYLVWSWVFVSCTERSETYMQPFLLFFSLIRLCTFASIDVLVCFSSHCFTNEIFTILGLSFYRTKFRY